MRDYAAAAFGSQFANRDEFDSFYEALADDDKDEFLRVGSGYLFLVKQGDWHVDVQGSKSVIDYFTNSFKLVSLFSLIESLSQEKHQDFFEWLSHSGNDIYPIRDKANLKHLHERYKVTFGSIRRCIAFLHLLPQERQGELRRGLKINGEPVQSIKVVAQFLYILRSQFVHEGEFVLDISHAPVVSRHKSATTITEISMPKLLTAFEEGVIAHFTQAT